MGSGSRRDLESLTRKELAKRYPNHRAWRSLDCFVGIKRNGTLDCMGPFYLGSNRGNKAVEEILRPYKEEEYCIIMGYTLP